MNALEKTRLALVAGRDELITEISAINFEYWDWFQAENEKVQKLRAAGLTDKLLAHVAPVLEKKRSGRQQAKNSGDSQNITSTKYYLVWKLFNNQGFRRVNKHASAHITVSSHDHIATVVGKHCTWELQKFLETEAKLAPLRLELDGLHHAEVKIKAAMRTYARKFNQQKES